MKARLFIVKPDPKPEQFQSLEGARREISSGWKFRQTGAALWREALTNGAVWRRALLIGGVAGLLQIAVNQGDHWLRAAVDTRLVLKTLACPVVAIGLALIAAGGTYVENRKGRLG